MKVALDTNIVFAIFQREDAVADRVAEIGVMHIPFPVLSEMLFAAKKSARNRDNLSKIHEFMKACSLLMPTEETLGIYADIRLELEKKGRPIPVNDLWIAAICREHGVPLATRDAHFDEVGGLRILRW